MRAIVALVIVAVVLLITVAVFRSSSSRRAPRSREEEEEGVAGTIELDGPPGERPPEWWIERAQQKAERGSLREAIADVLFATRSAIERGGWIRYRKGLTNRDYLRAMRRQESRSRALAAIAREFELVYFGRRPATRAQYEECLRHHAEGRFHAKIETSR